MFFLNRLKSLSLYEGLAIFFAIALQIQVTLFASDTYNGLRICLADLSLPFLGLFILYSLLVKKTSWPQWSPKYFWVWPALIILVMSIALLNGYYTNGFMDQWALANKYIGVYILLAYMMVAGWIVTNVSNYQKYIALFCAIFITFYVFSILISALLLVLAPIFSTAPQEIFWLADFPWDSLANNRNTLVVIAAFCLTIFLWEKSHTKLALHTQQILWFLLPFFFLFNASRTGWIILSFLGFLTIILNWNSSKKNILPLVLGVIAVSFLTLGLNYSKPFLGQVGFMQQAISYNVQYVGDQKRLIAVEDGLDLYNQNNPILGSGLGTYKPFQIEKRGEFIDVIDFTGLWLLVETGILGLLVFSGFFITCLYTVYKKGFIERRDTFYFHKAVFTFLLCFAAMSLLHEFMYTRFVWFIVGLAMIRMKRETPTS